MLLVASWPGGPSWSTNRYLLLQLARVQAHEQSQGRGQQAVMLSEEGEETRETRHLGPSPSIEMGPLRPRSETGVC